MDTATKLAAFEIAGKRLVAGFMRCIQTGNQCEVTGRPCREKCGCREEVAAWCCRSSHVEGQHVAGMTETAPATWQEKQASKPDPIALALAEFKRPHASEQEAMADAIDVYEAALATWRECDEPGCSKAGGCGWPVEGGGYRRTCWDHATGLHRKSE